MRFLLAAVLAAVLVSSPLAAADEDSIPACSPGVPVALAFGPSDARASSDDRAELSGVVLRNKLLLTISNEALEKRKHYVQVFREAPGGGYEFTRDVLLFLAPKGGCMEADFEGLTRKGDVYFAITSHSANRRKQDADNDYKTNRRNLTRKEIGECTSRHQLVRFRIGAGPVAEQLKTISLQQLIKGHPVLSPFAGIPSKENGVDIEGIAALGDDLYVGFRGPVLRQNYVPILKLSQKMTRRSVENSKVLFVDLGGRGIRDIAPGPPGKDLVVLAGPNGDERQSFAIYFWDGQDQVKGRDRKASKPNPRCNLGFHGDDRQSSKPEGIAYVDTTAEGMRFLLVYDGKAPLKAELRTIK
jgi:hypothetical protein